VVSLVVGEMCMRLVAACVVAVDVDELCKRL
jgi:hypothetical protein